MNKYKEESDQAQRQRRVEKKCLYKKPFDTEEEALAQKGQSAYLCSVCRKWHRTSGIPRWVKNRNKKEDDCEPRESDLQDAK